MTSIAITRAFPAAILDAIAAWAESTTRPDAPRFDEYVQAKRAILDDFFTFVGKHPKDVAPADVLRWRDELAARGYSPTTVYGLVCRVSSFYNFVMKDDIISRLIGHNPTKAVHPDAPHPYQNRSAQALEDDDVQAILAVIRRRATEYLHAKRDHALFLLYILTGMRRAEVIGLRWGDVRTGEVMRIKTIAKGGYYVEREVTNPRAQTALLHYLSESDRLSSMKPETPLWTRHDRAGKPGPPLTSHAFVRNLKKYAREAGVGNVHLHQMRHTFARMVAEDTGSITETQDALDHKDVRTTRVYVRRIAVKKDKHSERIGERLGI